MSTSPSEEANAMSQKCLMEHAADLGCFLSSNGGCPSPAPAVSLAILPGCCSCTDYCFSAVWVLGKLFLSLIEVMLSGFFDSFLLRRQNYGSELGHSLYIVASPLQIPRTVRTSDHCCSGVRSIA